MKTLYLVGWKNRQFYIVAESECEAIERCQEKHKIAYLPVRVEKIIDKVDDHFIVPTEEEGFYEKYESLKKENEELKQEIEELKETPKEKPKKNTK